MSHILATDAELRRLLEKAKSIAVVGISDSPDRPSYNVAMYLRHAGYEIIPVNPGLQEWRGIRAYPTVQAIGRKVDVVDVFRRPDALPGVIDDAIAAGAGLIWTQLGVVNDAATDRAVAAGIPVVIDRCMEIEHARLIGDRAR